jgi:hypothetical protein
MGELGFGGIELLDQPSAACMSDLACVTRTTLPECTYSLKAVYYPNSEFLEAEIGSSPSRVWRTIMDGRDTCWAAGHAFDHHG